MSVLDWIMFSLCWAAPFALFALKRRQDYAQRDWASEDAANLKKFIESMKTRRP